MTNLFVAGCPRSGTTALTRLLNLHPEVVVGLERFKGLYGKSREIDPELFSKDRFFEFHEGESNYVPAKSAEATAFYDNAKTKFDKAKFVGDKYPQFFRFYGPLFKSFPDAKIIFIFRDASFVAQSWQRRADDTSRWPADNDARKAVGYWNDALAYTLAYTQIKRNAFVFVEYNEFFSAKEAGLLDLFRRLGATMNPTIEAQLAESTVAEYARTETVFERGLDLPKDVSRFIKNNADINLYRRAKRILEVQQTDAVAAA